MSIWAAKLEKPWHKDVPPGTHEKWANAAPTIAGKTVEITTGSRVAGTATEIATKVALDRSSAFKEEVGETIRDVAFETGTTIIAAVVGPFAIAAALIALGHDAFTSDPKNKWIKNSSE